MNDISRNPLSRLAAGQPHLESKSRQGSSLRAQRSNPALTRSYVLRRSGAEAEALDCFASLAMTAPALKRRSTQSLPGKRQRGAAGRAARLLGLLAALLVAAPARADPVPGLWDPGLHLDKPDITALKAIRFLTADDYPPLDFEASDGTLVGFNIDIARAVCAELRLPCTIQARRWDTLVEALETGKGDAMIASMRATPALRARLEFTGPYYLTPARFAARKDYPAGEIEPLAIAGKSVGVVKGSAHEGYLGRFFAASKSKPYEDFAALRRALKAGEIDLAFADGLTLAVWLGGEDAADCCAFRGGPFLDSGFFGTGVAIAVRRDDLTLRRALDYALARIWAKGQYAEIYRKYFPLSFY
jgi:polar amino acid transport system substrate-binding protein